MVFEGIQSIIQVYSMPLLYATALWFGVVGFVARMAMVMILTRINNIEIIPVSLKLHIMSLVVAYLVAPICAVFATALNALFFSDSTMLGLCSNLYVWYSVIMILSLRYLLCQTFVSVSCTTWQASLIGVDSFIAILGYLFFRGLHLL